MSVSLPTGWNAFAGGAINGDLCGEPQDCAEPPCGPIPQLVITPVGGDLQLSCTLADHDLNLEVVGGVGPFIWAANGGSLTVTGFRTARIDIAAPTDGTFVETVGRIAFFKPHAFTIGGQILIPQERCATQSPNLYAVEIIADVRLRSYDCLKRHLALAGDDIDNLYPDYPNPDNPSHPLSNPIGDVVADRTCTMSVDWPVINASTISCPHSDPEHWSVCATGCNVAATGNASVTVTATLAGKNGLHGTIWSGAPVYSEIKSLPLDISNEFAQFPTHDIEFVNYLDVRTQATVDAGCCTVPSGTPVLITVIDAENTVAILSIPVVDPS